MLKEYRTQHPALSAALKKDIYSAFSAYFSAKLVKSLPEADKPQEGESDQLFAVLDRLVQKDATDETWAKEARAKDEKFGLILASLVSVCVLSSYTLMVVSLDLLSLSDVRQGRARPSN